MNEQTLSDLHSPTANRQHNRIRLQPTAIGQWAWPSRFEVVFQSGAIAIIHQKLRWLLNGTIVSYLVLGLVVTARAEPDDEGDSR